MQITLISLMIAFTLENSLYEGWLVVKEVYKKNCKKNKETPKKPNKEEKPKK
jgi:hypothetical protein